MKYAVYQQLTIAFLREVSHSFYFFPFYFFKRRQGGDATKESAITCIEV